MTSEWMPIAEYDKTAESHARVLIAGGSSCSPDSMVDEWFSMGDESAVARWDGFRWSNDCERDVDAYREYQPVFWMPMPKGRATCQCRACLDNPPMTSPSAAAVQEAMAEIEALGISHWSHDGAGRLISGGMQTIMDMGCCGNALPSGECCGNAVPVPVEVEAYEQHAHTSPEIAELILRLPALAAHVTALTSRLAAAEKERDALREALEESHRTLAQAFSRIHGLPRSTDTALATQIGQTRARIEAALATTLPKAPAQPEGETP